MVRTKIFIFTSTLYFRDAHGFLTLFGLNSVPIGWRTDLDEKVEETFSCHTQSVRVRAAVASVCPYHSQMLVLRVAV